MKIQSFSIVVGSRACDAHCPFCVSKMTGLPQHADLKIDERNFAIACRMAVMNDTTTVLLTGKGEPTLYPDQITRFLDLLEPYKFPFIELQTNGMNIGELATTGKSPTVTKEHLETWYAKGMTTIAISAMDVKQEWNVKIYGSKYPKLEDSIRYLHELGFTVRLCIMLSKDNIFLADEFVDWCLANKADQFTMRPIRKPEKSQDAVATEWVETNAPSKTAIDHLDERFRKHYKPLLNLMHGATVYDVKGQNVCISDCLTLTKDGDDVRSLIFYANGRLCYDWQYKGATLLHGRFEDGDE